MKTGRVGDGCFCLHLPILRIPTPYQDVPADMAKRAGTCRPAAGRAPFTIGAMDDPGHIDLAERLADGDGVVMMIGGPDTGKTTFSRMLTGAAVELGRAVAYIDSDLAITSVGPPTCVGLK